MANRRILRANESEESVRQRAFQQGLKNFADYGAKAMATQRQKAMDDQRLERDAQRFAHEKDKWEAEKEQRTLDNKFRNEGRDFKREEMGWKREDRVFDKEENRLEREFKKRGLNFKTQKMKFDREKWERQGKWDVEDRALDAKKRERDWRRQDTTDDRTAQRFGWEGEDRQRRNKYKDIDRRRDEEDRQRKKLDDEEKRFYKREDRGIEAEDRQRRYGRQDVQDQYRAEDRGIEAEGRQRKYGREDIQDQYKAEDRDINAIKRKRDEEDRQREIDRAVEDRLLKMEDREMDIEDRQFNRGRQLIKENRQFSREANQERRAKEDQGFKRKNQAFTDRKRLLDENYVKQQRMLDLEAKEQGIDKAGFEEDQRYMPFSQTRDAEEMRFKHDFEMEKLRAREKAKAKAQAGNKIGKLSKGEEANDKAFAKDYNEWGVRGRGTYDKNMSRLKESLAKLKDEPPASLSGRFAGRMPDIMRSEESLVIEEDVRASAMGALRATLGAQFTEKEGERIMNASYNPRLEPEENIKKIEKAIKELETNRENIEARSAYFEEVGTLKGFKSEKSNSRFSKRRKFTREKNNSVPFMDDAQANENDIKIQKRKRLEELERKAKASRGTF
ncbi:MAG: hypothetical protein CL529_12715 [Aequorivita sp.]|nr:hypothetical protein [Aequorivita sp.]|tara:strand:+ start:15361 stop:17208 length:1848 start_codon:yes stop_codon:yes gene_type:complete